jgi:spectinomycin phosphotransferase
VRRIGPRYTAALLPFVDGQAGQFGRFEAGERAALVTMLAELHTAMPASAARRVDLELPGRQKLEAALQDLNQTWSGGPFAEPARQALAEHASYMAERLALYDRLAADVAARSNDWVVTHGEPHAGNVMRTDDGYVLVDWDTVALAPPERDLWMLADDAPDVDQAGVDFFRLRWELDDIAAFTDVLRSPHGHSADTMKAYDGLRTYLS